MYLIKYNIFLELSPENLNENFNKYLLEKIILLKMSPYLKAF